MKKLLLTLAVGMLMLSLPVIASAAPTLDNYSGYTASVTVRGFTLYSTANGANAGMKAFAKKDTAGTFATTGNNTYGTFDSGYLHAQVSLNPTTVIFLTGYNGNAPKAGRVVRANAYYAIYHVESGDMTIGSDGNPVAPTSAGLTATFDYIDGSGNVAAVVNPTTHNMTLALRNATAGRDYTETVQSVIDTNGDYSSNKSAIVWDFRGYYSTGPTYNYNWTVTGVGMSPVRFTPTAGSAGNNFSPWWQ
ncbi:MAG: hypothetical protein ACYDFU_00175 [Nitrospirota bacterium]